ncbi:MULTISPECIES: carbon storage regulator CsrA [Brevibacillus]|uniref:carbon storage regulator CsrA n=1 Tax=Brevibacillus TaxID=55080 RepID=UPI00156B7CEB|nr:MULTISPECIES: carbon storage regulator CsrA [Brevibacillus]NRR03458.1 carbon storage regulator CsrA [Brevibacillus sp. RS1.1]WJQ81124.1 carbon storage regulator CsrA [Brevibacillus brevis]
MLVLSRKKNESIMIGDLIEIKIVSVDGDLVRIGIEAPLDYDIYRKEIYIAIQQENKLATQNKVEWSSLKQLVDQGKLKGDSN